jgi:hypothetical protein
LGSDFRRYTKWRSTTIPRRIVLLRDLARRAPSLRAGMDDLLPTVRWLLKMESLRRKARVEDLNPAKRLSIRIIPAGHPRNMSGSAAQTKTKTQKGQDRMYPDATTNLAEETDITAWVGKGAKDSAGRSDKPSQTGNARQKGKKGDNVCDSLQNRSDRESHIGSRALNVWPLERWDLSEGTMRRSIS